MTDTRMPVTLLTGFLGAGKTTLPNAVLADSSVARIAVIVNEFGAAGLDHDLIPDRAFDVWLDTLVALRGSDILRNKGIVFLQDMERPFVFHEVQQIFDRPVPLEKWTGADRRSRIVVIARDMSRPEIQRSLDVLRARIPNDRPPRSEQKEMTA